MGLKSDLHLLIEVSEDLINGFQRQHVEHLVQGHGIHVDDPPFGKRVQRRYPVGTAMELDGNDELGAHFRKLVRAVMIGSMRVNW